MPGYTTADLLTSVKNRAMIPDASTGSFSDDALLQFATEELQGPITTMILSARENYYETYFDQPIVSLQLGYEIPERATGGVVAVVQFIYLNAVYNLTPIASSGAYTLDTALYPSGFYFQNNSVVLFPTPTGSQGTLRMRYFQRVSRLTETTNCGQILSFSTLANTVTLTNVPTNFISNTLVDFIPQFIPYTPYGLNSAITGVSGNVVSFSALPPTIAVGDWISLAEFTPIPEIPFEMFQVLSQATALRYLEAAGDVAKIPLAAQKLQAYMDSALKMITPRDQNGPKKIVSGWRYF